MRPSRLANQFMVTNMAMKRYNEFVVPEAQEARVVPAGEFKAKCLKLMDEVNETGIPIVITKRGKPVSRLVPAGGEGMGICGTFPEFAGFWDDPSETVIDPESVAAMADDWA